MGAIEVAHRSWCKRSTYLKIEFPSVAAATACTYEGRRNVAAQLLRDLIGVTLWMLSRLSRLSARALVISPDLLESNPLVAGP